MKMKEIKYNLKNWRSTPCSRFGRFTIIMMSVLSKFICTFNAISVKIFYIEINSEDYSKIYHKGQRTRLLLL